MKNFICVFLFLSICLSALYAQKKEYKLAFFVNEKEWDLSKSISLKEKPKLDIRILPSTDNKNKKDIYVIDEIAFGANQDSLGFTADGLIRAKNKDASLGIRVTMPFDLKEGDIVEYRVHQVFIRKENGNLEPVENSAATLTVKVAE